MLCCKPSIGHHATVGERAHGEGVVGAGTRQRGVGGGQGHVQRLWRLKATVTPSSVLHPSTTATHLLVGAAGRHTLAAAALLADRFFFLFFSSQLVGAELHFAYDYNHIS